MRRLGLRALAVAAGLLACTASETPTQPASDAPPPVVSEREPEAPTTTVEPPPPEPEPYAPDPEGFGDPCSADDRCGWDDPCAPRRCVGAEHVPEIVGCEETAPAPGECTCFAGHCTLRPSAPAPVEGRASCKLEPCGLDQGAGVCTSGTMREANRMTRDSGPACHCDHSTTTCEFVWVETIACDDVSQCWVSDASPYHPVARPKALRNKKFRPCRDGEVAPVCRDGRCSTLAYSC